jgi:hypothetical protein
MYSNLGEYLDGSARSGEKSERFLSEAISWIWTLEKKAKNPLRIQNLWHFESDVIAHCDGNITTNHNIMISLGWNQIEEWTGILFSRKSFDVNSKTVGIEVIRFRRVQSLFCAERGNAFFSSILAMISSVIPAQLRKFGITLVVMRYVICE